MPLAPVAWGFSFSFTFGAVRRAQEAITLNQSAFLFHSATFPSQYHPACSARQTMLLRLTENRRPRLINGFKLPRRSAMILGSGCWKPRRQAKACLSCLAWRRGLSHSVTDCAFTGASERSRERNTMPYPSLGQKAEMEKWQFENCER
jgi:hypothetical protein